MSTLLFRPGDTAVITRDGTGDPTGHRLAVGTVVKVIHSEVLFEICVQTSDGDVQWVDPGSLVRLTQRKRRAS